MKIKFTLTLNVAALALAFSACSTTNNATANANKSNTAVVTNSNSAATTNTAAPAANTAPAATNTATSSAPVEGDVLKIDEAGIQMVVPKGFKFSRDGQDTIVSTDDEGVEVRFHVPKDGDYDKAVKDAASELDDYITDVKFEENGVKETVNGMEAVSYSGTGKDADKKQVNWDMTIFKSPKKPVLAVIYAEKASIEKHGADVKKFLSSVKAM